MTQRPQNKCLCLIIRVMRRDQALVWGKCGGKIGIARLAGCVLGTAAVRRYVDLRAGTRHVQRLAGQSNEFGPRVGFGVESVMDVNSA